MSATGSDPLDTIRARLAEHGRQTTNERAADLGPAAFSANAAFHAAYLVAYDIPWLIAEVERLRALRADAALAEVAG